MKWAGDIARNRRDSSFLWMLFLKSAYPLGMTLVKKIDNRIRRKALALAAVAAAAVFVPAADALPTSWKPTVGSGNWSDANNWSPGLPGSFYADVAIIHADAINRIVNYDYSGTNLFSSLSLNNTGGGVDTLNQLANNLSANSETIGFSGGVGALNISGGTNAFGSLKLGLSGGTGSLSFSGGLLQALNGTEYIGQHPGTTGFLKQTGGTHTIAFNLYLGLNSGRGTYELDNGSLMVGSEADIGYQKGVGIFNQNGGSLNCNAWLSIGDQGGVGIYNMDGGTIKLGEALNLGDWQNNATTASGTLNMTNGTITAALGFVGKGYNSTGLLVQSGGTIMLSGPQGMSISGGVFANSHVSGTYQLLGGVLASSGTGILDLNANGVFQVGTNATIVGFGPFNHTGGTATFAGTLTIDPSGTAAIKSYNQTGGTFSAQAVVNNGTFSSTNGTASVGAMTGTGSLAIGGGTGTALVLADSLVQSNVTVDSGGTLNIGPAGGLVQPMTISGALTITNSATVTLMPTANPATASGVKTNFVKSLNIGSNGLLDLQNHFVSVDNTATPFATVHQYIDAGYNRNAATGFGDYAGLGGISSSVVKAKVDSMGVGYYNGALQDPANPDNVGQILGPNANSGHGTGIPLTQILIRPTLTGDLNGDGVVNAYDVNLFNSFGLFNQTTTLGYQAGDLNGDGVVDSKDVTIFNTAGNFNQPGYSATKAGAAKAANAVSTRTGHEATPASMLINPPGTLILFVNYTTGDVSIRYNGFTGFAGKQPFNTTTHALSFIDIRVTGATFGLDGTKLTPAATSALSGVTLTGNTEINLTAINGYLPDNTDLGRILPPGLNEFLLLDEMTFTFNYTGSRQIEGGFGGLYVEPEPTCLSILALTTLGLMARRRAKAAAPLL